jgi:hypothetical protein
MFAVFVEDDSRMHKLEEMKLHWLRPYHMCRMTMKAYAETIFTICMS